MLFSEKIDELTRTRNKALLAREAKLGDNLKNWRDGRADRDGPKYWGPVVRLANACELNAKQTTELLLLAQKPSFEELQYAKPDETSSYADATKEAIAAIRRRSMAGSLSSYPTYRQVTLDSRYVINEGDIIPRERLSDEQLIPILQEAEKKKLRLEPKVFYVVTSAVAVALVIIIATLIASPAARERAGRMVLPVIETVRQFFEERFGPSPQPVPTMSPEPVPTATMLPSATPTWTVTPVTAPTLNGTGEAGIRATDIAVAVNQTLVAATQTALAATPDISTLNNSGTPIPTQAATSVSEPPCEVEIISQEGPGSVAISFRTVPDGTGDPPIFYQPGTRAFIESVSPDGRWFQVKINDQTLGWADPKYFSDCIEASQ